MLLYAWMLFVETAPERYDAGMRLMTLGRLDRIKDEIADTVRPGERILDLGCGTGTLAVRCLERGAHVTGLDSSTFMLAQAREKAQRTSDPGRFQAVKDSVTQLHKHFGDATYDTIVATAALGEFPRSYLRYVFRECHRILRAGGRLVIADELQPEHRLARLLYGIAMAILWIPQFLLVRRVAYPIRDLPGVLREAGFRLQARRRYSLSQLQLLSATRDPAGGQLPVEAGAGGLPGR